MPSSMLMVFIGTWAPRLGDDVETVAAHQRIEALGAELPDLVFELGHAAG